MLRLAIIFFVIAIIASVFSFGGVAEGSENIAKIFLAIFVVLAILSLIFGGLRGGSNTPVV